MTNVLKCSQCGEPRWGSEYHYCREIPMKLSEAAKKGITRVRLQSWGGSTYAKLTLVDGKLTPWMLLYDREFQQIAGYSTPQPVMIAGDSESCYLEYCGQIDQDDAGVKCPHP